MHPVRNALRLAAMSVIAAAATAHAFSAHAGEHRYRLDNAAYRQECGACHVAFPPRLLAAPSWRAVMAGLDIHFGDDATLEPAVQREISAWLRANAGGRDTSAGGKPMLRITATPWFRNEHRHEIEARVQRRAEVRSFANCGACHSGADRGDYPERGIRVPGGRPR
ncbi:MAG TPA: diheme cytochrome c [Usitatibacteraceae bacterium]|jgi:hypothetical protein|nr:diheme cytochrome c [Usitatibacteraceae bacterium]